MTDLRCPAIRPRRTLSLVPCAIFAISTALALLPASGQPITSTTAAASGCCDLSGNAFDPLGPDGQWWTQVDYVRTGKLKAEQQQRLNEIYSRSIASIESLQQRYVQAYAVLHTMLSAEKPNEDAVDAQIVRVEEARAAAAKAIVLVKLNLRPILTEDQWKQIQKLQQKKSK